RANKSVCGGYEEYLNNKRDSIDKNTNELMDALKSAKGDVDKMQKVLQKSDNLLKQKENDIGLTKSNITYTKKEITKTEKDILKRLEMMQEVNSENLVIDFITSSTNLQDFLMKFDGLNAINEANSSAVEDLKHEREVLDKQQKNLVKEEKSLVKAKEAQKILLKDYRGKETDIFTKLEGERKKKAIYNTNLDSLNLKEMEDDLNNGPVSNGGNTSKPKPTKPSPSKPKPTKPTNPGNNNGGSTTKPTKPTKPDNNGGNTSKPKPKPDTNTGLINPVSHATVTAVSWYYPASFGGAWHPGIDLANNTGTPVKSPGKGVLLMKASEYGGYGNYMVTAHQNGKDTYTYLYGHLNSFANVGTTLSKGQTIGYMGSTGNSTGPHTHVEVFKHKNQSLNQVRNKYKKSYDIYFGLGYMGKNGSKVQRLKPHTYLGLKYGQRY
ncbi:MAG: peptidoglycan DD-metalloendopeptidase family protein, partial [Erysipelotrichales bacterium]